MAAARHEPVAFERAGQASARDAFEQARRIERDAHDSSVERLPASASEHLDVRQLWHARLDSLDPMSQSNRRTARPF
jgi:hypothetical protein